MNMFNDPIYVRTQYPLIPNWGAYFGYCLILFENSRDDNFGFWMWSSLLFSSSNSIIAATSPHSLPDSVCKINLLYGLENINSVAQNGHLGVLRSTLVLPSYTGCGIWDQYWQHASLPTWPHGLKTWVGIAASSSNELEMCILTNQKSKRRYLNWHENRKLKGQIHQQHDTKGMLFQEA